MQTISIEQGLRALQRFLVAEWHLALPVALAFLALPPLLIGLFVQPFFVTAPATIEGMRTIGAALPWWFGPLILAAGAVAGTGALALTALAVIPRISVGEALRVGLGRLGGWLVACILVGFGSFAGLVLVGAVAAAVGGGQVAIFAATFVTLVAASLYLVLTMPVFVDARLGPVATLRRSWAVYHGQFPRLAGGLVLYIAIAWIAGMAVQVALGSVLLLIGRLLDAPEIGRTFAMLLSALVSAVEWGSFYLFVAMLYRQRIAAR